MSAPPWADYLPWLMQYRWWIIGVLGVLVVIVLIIETISKGRRETPTTHGSGRWATRREIIQAGLTQRHGIILGKLGKEYLRHDGEEHCSLVSPTRGGKGVGHIIPSILAEGNKSVIVTDPKDGENYDVTAGWRAKEVGPVYAFTPCKEPTTRINVLDYIRLKTRQEFGDAQLIAQSLVAPERLQRENHTSLHFRELAGHLLTAAILHTCYTSRRRSLAGVWEFLTQQHDSLDKSLQAMMTTQHVSAGVHQAIVSLSRMIKNITGDRELSSVWSTATRPLVLYNDDLIADSTDTSDIDLDDLQYGPTPISLYLIASNPMQLERLHPVYRVILDVALNRLMEHKVRTWTHRLDTIYDELPAYGYTKAIEKGIPVMAGYGIKAMLVMQDLESLWETYGTHTQIWGNCKVKIFHAPDNDLTAKRISENLLGRKTEENLVESRQMGLERRGSVSYQHLGRPLLMTDEVMDLPAHQLIVRITGMKPILAEKVDYRSDANFQERLRPIPSPMVTTIVRHPRVHPMLVEHRDILPEVEGPGQLPPAP